jgi:hypothetical protein
MALSHALAATTHDRVLAADGLYYGFYGFRYAG